MEFNPYYPGAIANYFLEKSWKNNVPITNMQLQKLIYFAAGWHYVLRMNHQDNLLPLINEPIQAWEYGPVCSSVYHEFKGFGNNPIYKDSWMTEVTKNPKNDKFEVKRNQIHMDDEATKRILDQVWDNYSELSALALSSITHKNDPDNPWQKAHKEAKEQKLIKGKEMPYKDIKEYFKKIYDAGEAY